MEQFYCGVNDATKDLDEVHVRRLRCRRGCSGCCADGITVFEIEAWHILQNHAHWLKASAPHPSGSCAFLDDAGACRIYEDRPYVCRTQGYPLRWVDTNADGEIVEYRDICPLNDTDDQQPLETLSELDCWTLGVSEERLAWMQFERDGVSALGKAAPLLANNPSRRVELRELFALARYDHFPVDLPERPILDPGSKSRTD